ncbi:3'(2'),5'-bisphosphate nucleotidase CysQ [Pseudopedobacter beijingensis]|uniref:3'(2'),5'-bisphosphate nucleotidase CysQ n=1 Tax=Pseudopedobacter beijingensis TaxID=1207056 RepID=A0ABW4IB27_9SPHI
MIKINITELLEIAKEAGKGILDIYNKPLEELEISLKADSSPLTIADKISHDIIVNGLEKLFPFIPILSEEGKDIPYDTRKNWEYYWCIDPLDGTKEFINKNGEFTVNIALIHNNIPVLGIIYLPVVNTIYYGSSETGSWKISKEKPERLEADIHATEWISIGSRSHASTEEAGLLSKYPVVRSVSAGSSLKFCMIAEGKAHIYYRHGPTMEWDTAAGHAIAINSGANVTHLDGSEFTYNKPSLLNQSFLCKI